MTDFSRLSRFGMTFKPLTESRGQELLMLYLADFHAKTSARQEKAMGLTESEAECGNTWRGWLAKFNPDSFSWRTAQCSFLEDLNECLQTLPRWGMTRNGLLWELPTLELTTSGTGCGLSESWPTPRSCSAMAATITPESAWNEKRNPNLETIVGKRMFPTPCQRDYKGAVKAGKRVTKSGKIQNYGEQFPNVVGGKLNPTWVEWLMGWPLEWTDLKPLEMDKSHFVRQQHGES
jgi:hypothetical protein